MICYDYLIQETPIGHEDNENPLFINCSGYIKSEDENVTMKRTRMDYYLIYLVNGIGHFLINNEWHEVKAGDILIYKPNEKQYYSYHSHEQAELYWIHFTGRGVFKLLNSLGLANKHIYKTGLHTDCINLFDNIAQEIMLKKPMFHQFCLSYFVQLLSLFSRDILLLQHGENNEKDSDIDVCIKKMQMEYQNCHSIVYYANISNLSVYQFIRKFKARTQLTPSKYIEKIRINKSKELIGETDLSINEISNIVGYTDPFYFSKVFKKSTGMSPTDFRNKFDLTAIS